MSSTPPVMATPVIAALFPGQGSQKVGMAQSWLAHPVGGAVLRQAFATLPDLEQLMFAGPEEALKLTENAQPALVAAAIAAYQGWRADGGPQPAYAAGHSLGEFAAHVAAGSLELATALRLVRLRGQAMQAAVAVGDGAMAAVLKLTPAQIAEVVDGIAGVEVANFNSPEQTVISGQAAAVETACALLKAKGGRTIALQVSAPFHSSLMQPAQVKLQAALAETSFLAPQMPVIANVTAQAVSEPSEIVRLLGEQVTAPVRWVETIEHLAALGVTEFIEFGPGSVLTGLVKRIIPDAAVKNVN
jgi:[acyl-carrier-protein] S-malonyltransferase